MKRRSEYHWLAGTLSVLCMVGCGGLDPGSLPPDAFITGTITYVGGVESWPDSNVIQVRVLAFEQQPTTEDEIVQALTSGKVAVSDTLHRYVASGSFALKVPTPPRTFHYVVVAMQNGPNFLKDWLMIGVFSTSGDPLDPTTVRVDVGQTVPISFIVDFDHLPPQPIQ